MNLVFDIETCPLPEETVLERCPEPKIPKNIKDPEKIQARVDGHKQEVMDRACLDAMLCRVAAIGYGGVDGGIAVDNELQFIDKVLPDSAVQDDCEAKLLEHFWLRFSAAHELGFRLIGHTCLTYDVPMIVRRSWLLGVDVPAEAFERGRLSPTFVDLADLWRCGDRSVYVSLEAMGRAFDVPGEPSNITGADWHKWYFSGDEDRRAIAVKYLHRDVDVTREVAAAMGVL